MIPANKKPMSKFKATTLLEYFKPAPKKFEFTENKSQSINSNKIRKRKMIDKINDELDTSFLEKKDIVIIANQNIQNVPSSPQNKEKKLNDELQLIDYQENGFNHTISTKKFKDFRHEAKNTVPTEETGNLVASDFELKLECGSLELKISEENFYVSYSQDKEKKTMKRRIIKS